jgi:hypothetical protein
MCQLESNSKTAVSSSAAKKRREPTGGNLHTGKWHAWCRNEGHAYA